MNIYCTSHKQIYLQGIDRNDYNKAAQITFKWYFRFDNFD